MNNLLCTITAILLCFVTTNLAIAQSCDPTPQRHAWSVSSEVQSNSVFEQTISDNWTLRLAPAPFGWNLQILDNQGTDLSQITPPFHLSPNARELYGWHFRNADNTGPNTGEVNAPQHLRLFNFAPVAHGFQPPTSLPEPGPDDGRGALTILDMTLSDPELGEQARMERLAFSICLSWPKSVELQPTEPVHMDASDPIYSDDEYEIMADCGLNPQFYTMSAWVLPRMVAGDFDGDDALDYVVPITRLSDQQKGIALCRAGTWLSIFGYDPALDVPLKTLAGEPKNETYFTVPQYLESTEYWQVRRNEFGRDEVILGRMDKAELAIRWHHGGLVHELLWVLISS